MTQIMQFDTGACEADAGLDCHFLSPDHPMIGHGQLLCSADLPGMTPREQIAVMLETAKREGTPPVVMGALPFWTDCAPALVLPRRITRLRPADLATLRAADPIQHDPLIAWQTGGTTQASYLNGVGHILSLIKRGITQKLVLSRDVTFEAIEEICTATVLQRLLTRHSAAYLFSVPLRYALRGKQGRFIGASPELLIRKHGQHVHSNPLAGTIAADADPGTDAARVAQLQGSAKDLLEHAYTANSVRDVLRQFCEDVICPTTPVVMRAGALHHLSSAISGRINTADTDVLRLAEALHPTPAVGGFPTAGAARRIREIEGRPRGLYAGLVGWCDAAGNGEWAVSLRCAEIAGKTVTLSAGGGIVQGSDPDTEFAETETKLQTMRAALNLTLGEAPARPAQELTLGEQHG